MDTPNESEVSAVLQMKSGVAGTFHVNADTLTRDQANFAIYGTEGALLLGDPNQFGCPVRLIRQPGGPEDVTELAFTHGYSEESRGLGAADLAIAVLNSTASRTDCQMAVHVLDVLSAMLQPGTFHHIESSCMRPSPMPVNGFNS